MVAIAQLVEPWIVIPVVASSNLVSHPIILVAFASYFDQSVEIKFVGE